MANNESVEIRRYDAGDEQSLIELWQECGLTRPWNPPQKEIAFKLRDSSDMLLVAEQAWAA